MAATVAIGIVLAAAEPAPAHFSVLPGVVTDGERVELVVELPAIGGPPASVVVEGRGVSTISSEAADGGAAGESRWTVVVRVDTGPGPLPVTVLARDARGRTSSFRSTLTVVPSESSNGFPWLATAIGAAAGLALALVAVRLARRRA